VKNRNETQRPWGFGRRRFLRQLGVSAAAVPFVIGLDSLFAHAQTTESPKKRFIFCYSPNGALYYNFRLRLTELDADISDGTALAHPNLILNPLQENAANLLVLDRLSWVSARAEYQEAETSPDGLDHPGGHQKGMGSMLTGQVLIGGEQDFGNAGMANGVSFDQVLATELFADKKFPSLEVGVQVSENLTDRFVDKRVSYDDANIPRTPANDPFALFTSVFGAPGASDAAKALRRRLDGSVLDAALGDFARLGSKVSAADKLLLEQHAEAIRQLERQIENVVDCTTITPLMTPDGLDPLDPTASHEWAMDPDNFQAVNLMMMDIVVQAVACGLTNVVTMMWANSETDLQYPWLNVLSGHHGMSHERNPQLVDVDRWYAAQFNTLINRFKAINESEGEGTLLDNSLLMWTSCLGDGAAHKSDNIPVVLAGSNGGYFKQGRNIQFNSVYTAEQWAGDPLGSADGQALIDAADEVRSGDQRTVGTPDLSNNDLAVSILNSFGIETETFGDPRFCKGPLPGITA
jgi:hypothetical protein